MSGLLKFIRAQFGLSATPANNYTIRNPADGTLRISRGNAGAESADVLTFLANNGLQAASNPATGNRSTLLATMQKFADEFDASLAASGYQKLPSGLIVQWGAATSNNASDQGVTFPIAFPTAFRTVVLTPVNNAASPTCFGSIGAASVSGFNFSLRNTAGSRVIEFAYWMAIGN